MTEEQRRPWWTVTGVFDPEGEGSDFSYTEGLALRGLPELHVWGRPPRGDDPGLDWCLSHQDRGALLNELAWRLLNGRLAVGDRWESEYDGGLTTARFEVGEPVGSGEVEAYGAGDAPVLPILWELHREPAGPLMPMTPAAEEEAAQLLTELAAVLGAAAVPPRGWSLDLDPDWSEDQVFGPRTSLVRARAAQLWQADEEQLIGLLSNLVLVAPGRSPGYALAVAASAARGVGRGEALDRVDEAAHDLASEFGLTWAVELQEPLQQHFRRAFREPRGDGPPSVWSGLLSALREAVVAFLVVETVADVMPVEYLTWGRGPVLTGFNATATAPDRRFRCSDAVADQVVSVLRAARPDELFTAAMAWNRWQNSPAELELEGLRITGATHAPEWHAVMSRASVALMSRLLVSHPHGGYLLQQWSNALAAVLSERATLPADTVRTFIETARHIPGVGRLVNEAIVA